MKAIIGAIVRFDDGHEQVIEIGPEDSVEVLVRQQGLSLFRNGSAIERHWPGDVATEEKRRVGIRVVSWLRAEPRREDGR